MVGYGHDEHGRERFRLKAAVLYGKGDVRVTSIPDPRPGPEDVLIRVRACGVCGTDNSLYKGDYPASYPVVIGHEFAGEVVEAGAAVRGLAAGDRVTADPNRVCHACAYCRSGREHLCENLSSMGVHRDGADAEYCIMPATNVYRIPDSLSYEEAAFSEPLACAVHGVDLAGIRLGDTVLIIGAGPMGNLITQLAARAGAASIVVSEPIALRRERAAESGATHLIDPTRQEVDRELRKVQRIGADVVFEVAGSSEAQASCLPLARKGGTIVFFGVSPQDRTIPVNPFVINENELAIRGSFNNAFATSRAVGLLAAGACRVTGLISHRLPLSRYLEVFRLFGGADTLKLMVSID
jgi:2-desacetyl-2-hydroxyethyl bacteriochlorophyllide A dehydrogenase